MEAENVANLLGALATMVSDGVIGAIAPGPDALAEQTALALLIKYPDCSIQALRAPLALSHSGCVRLVDRLVDAGRVERRLAVDGRAVALRLTRRGRAVATSKTQLRADALAHLLGTLTHDERAVLGHLATRLLAAGTPSPEVAGRTCRLCDYKACLECPLRDRFSDGATSE